MFIILTSVFFGVIFALAIVSIRFLVSDHLAKKFYKLFAAADLAMIIVVLGGWYVRSLIPETFVAFFGNIATIFLMSQLICGVLVILAVIGRFFYRKFNKPQPFDPARRRMLAYAFLYPIMSLAMSLYGNRIEKNSDVMNFFDVPIKNLPPDLEGFKLAQISDIHLGAYYSKAFCNALPTLNPTFWL